MRDDPELIHAVIHALNEWMHETWTFNYEDRIFATPVITLPIVEKAIEELEWVRRAGRQDRAHPPGAGARASAAPARSAFEEFDPFWQAVVDADILVSMHASDSGYSRYHERLDRADRRCCRSSPTRSACMTMGKRPIEDTMAALRLPRRAHPLPGAARSPSVENGGDWVVPFLEHLGRHLQEDARRRSTRTRSRRSSATSGSARSTRTTSARSIDADRRRPHRCSGPTTRTPRASPSPARTSTTCRRASPDDVDRQDHGRQPRPAHAASASASA